MPSVKQLKLDHAGGIVGVCNTVGWITQGTRLFDAQDRPEMVKYHDSEWFTGPFGLCIKNALPIKLVGLTGKLGFFETNINPL
jgi:hypothetical protein